MVVNNSANPNRDNGGTVYASVVANWDRVVIRLKYEPPIPGDSYRKTASPFTIKLMASIWRISRDLAEIARLLQHRYPHFQAASAITVCLPQLLVRLQLTSKFAIRKIDFHQPSPVTQ
ncbi:hypothetical protein [Shinella sp. WSJ-2]|uniref:hypothetical protein n=1 Tax=Shinella sp. WSJ-2 TaxID=2303749 RepID=UPI001FE0DF36|nr:hypothetical protein [Shinella sp. WSJ-2]